MQEYHKGSTQLSSEYSKRTSLAINHQRTLNIETNLLICRANQPTGFFMKGTLFINGLSVNS